MTISDRVVQNKTTTTTASSSAVSFLIIGPAIAGTDDCILPETLEHMMLRCTCPALSASRASIIAALTQIAGQAHGRFNHTDSVAHARPSPRRCSCLAQPACV